MILYEDAALVVLDKPAGLSSEEGVPAALRAHWKAPDAFVGVVHRLDTGVSGLMVYARTPAAAAALSRQVTQSWWSGFACSRCCAAHCRLHLPPTKLQGAKRKRTCTPLVWMPKAASAPPW